MKPIKGSTFYSDNSRVKGSRFRPLVSRDEKGVTEKQKKVQEKLVQERVQTKEIKVKVMELNLEIILVVITSIVSFFFFFSVETEV